MIFDFDKELKEMFENMPRKPALQTEEGGCACAACEAQLPDECGCGMHLCPNCDCCEVHCECGYYDQEVR